MPATIPLLQFRELWIHTGTACNLNCPFCHEGSKPGDERLGAPTLEMLQPLLQDAAQRGVERFAFTGGEPLILRGILEILIAALQLRPVLVLTNGTAPFIRRAHQLAVLREQPHAVEFRISIDHPNEQLHDAERGLKNFRKAFDGLRILHAAGFAVSIVHQQLPGEDTITVHNRFRNLLRRQRLPEDLPLVALPPLQPLTRSANSSSPPPPEEVQGMPGIAVPPPTCAYGRMAVVRGKQLRLTACPLVDNDVSFDADPNLAESLAAPIVPRHTHCRICLSQGVNTRHLAVTQICYTYDALKGATGFDVGCETSVAYRGA
jgi:pyruvate-formate lyase-activating enzyme